MRRLPWGTMVLLAAGAFVACDDEPSTGHMTDGGAAGEEASTAGKPPRAGSSAGGGAGVESGTAGLGGVPAASDSPAGAGGAQPGMAGDGPVNGVNGGEGGYGASGGDGSSAGGAQGGHSSGEGGACTGSVTVGVCVVDPNWTCETWYDCPGESCSKGDHKCYPARKLNEACDDDHRCLPSLDCVGVCVEPDDNYLCDYNGCELGQFCRYYAIGDNGAACVSLETNLEDYACRDYESCGPRYYCGEDSRCHLRPIDCSNDPNVCGKQFYCDRAAGICRGQDWNAPCGTNTGSCPGYSFCNGGRCQALPQLGEPCQDGRCSVKLRCEPEPGSCATN